MLQKNKVKGFTLVELMVVIAIVGILSAISYPSYVAYTLKSNRSEALTELVRIANLQEQYYVDNRTYTADMKIFGSTSSDELIVKSERYSITSTLEDSNNSFTLKATAQGTQHTNDTKCTEIEITDVGLKTPEYCWE